MIRRAVLACFSLVVSLAACSPASQERPPAPSADETGYQIETIADGLAHPWGLAFLPDGDLLVTERNGGLRRISNGAVLEDPVEGGPQDGFYGGQGGLLDIILSPDFEQTGFLYLSYASGEAGANTPALYRAQYENGALVNGETIFRAEPLRRTEHHYGGRLAFLPDGTLLMTLGDGFEDREQAQLRSNHLGAFIRLTTDGAPAPDNPFFDEGGAAAYVYSYGHRNMQGVAVDARTGDIWTHEHGPDGGDELNRIEAGGNYGWPIATEGLDYNGARISPFFNHDGYAAPVHVWTPSIAPSGLAIYEGELFPDWQGDLFVTALSGKALHRLDLDNGAVVFEERFMSEDNTRLRHVMVGPEGGLWLLTDYPDGALLRMTPSR